MTAVDGISFNVKKGEVFAFLGPNGAGKSTTIKMLITLLSPTAGKALISNFDITRNSHDVREVIGYVPQMISVDGTLTAYENLMLMAKLYGVPPSQRHQRIADIIKFFQLEKHADKLVRTYSGGMIRKLEIGQAIIHRPKVIFLDEPTTGLDPAARRSVWDHLQKLKQELGTTIFFSTHYMDEATEVADRVAIMKNGRIAAIGSIPELEKETKQNGATLEDAFIYFTGGQIRDDERFGDVVEERLEERQG